MFPVTHIWFAERVLGELNNQSALGTIFPDMVILGCLEYDTTHKSGWKLLDFLGKDHPEFLGFARGILTHGVNPKGLDYYSDEKYKDLDEGYCFQKAREIEKRVIESCNIPEKMGLWKAHNFIEMAVELEIHRKYPSANKKMKAAMKDMQVIDNICPILDKYYDLKNGTMKSCVEHFGAFVELERPTAESLAVKYDFQMYQKHGIHINILKSRDIIDDCRQIISSDMFDFFDYVNIKVVEMIRSGEENR